MHTLALHMFIYLEYFPAVNNRNPNPQMAWTGGKRIRSRSAGVRQLQESATGWILSVGQVPSASPVTHTVFAWFSGCLPLWWQDAAVVYMVVSMWTEGSHTVCVCVTPFAESRDMIIYIFTDIINLYFVEVVPIYIYISINNTLPIFSHPHHSYF